MCGLSRHRETGIDSVNVSTFSELGHGLRGLDPQCQPCEFKHHFSQSNDQNRPPQYDFRNRDQSSDLGGSHVLTRVIRELERIVSLRGRLIVIVSDNGTELTGHAVLEWWQEGGIDWHYIAAGLAHGQCLHQIVQWLFPGRVPQCFLVPEPERCTVQM